MKKVVLRNFTKFTGKHLCRSLCNVIKKETLACNFIKKETLAQVFSCESCVISENTFFTEHLWWLLLKTSESNEHFIILEDFNIDITNRGVELDKLDEFCDLFNLTNSVWNF